MPVGRSLRGGPRGLLKAGCGRSEAASGAVVSRGSWHEGSALAGHGLFLTLLQTLQISGQDFGGKITFNVYVSVASQEARMSVKMSELSASL